jgi:hypothetical protein
MNVIAGVEQGKNFKKAPLPLPQGNCFVRMLTAKAISRLSGVSPQVVARWMWPSDKITNELLEQRAASAPAMTTVAGWAAELAQRRVYDAVEALGPASAGREVLRNSLVLSFDGAAQISVPGFVASGVNAGFVAEGDPIPVRQLADTAALLQAYKMASIAVLTREMMESSNAEALIGDALIRSAGIALDTVLFDSNPATAARPAGLRNGIAATTASANADFIEAFAEDITSLVNATSAVGGNGPYIIVASPGRAAAMALRFIEEAKNLIVLGSSAVGNDVVVIAVGALVAAIEPDPNIETATASTLHMDTAPQPIGSVGPEKSMYQTDSLALKVRWPMSWALRDPRGVAWLTPAWK